MRPGEDRLSILLVLAPSPAEGKAHARALGLRSAEALSLWRVVCLPSGLRSWRQGTVVEIGLMDRIEPERRRQMADLLTAGISTGRFRLAGPELLEQLAREAVS